MPDPRDDGTLESAGPMPANAGIGLKAEHYRGLLAARPRVGFLEIHVENYMGAGGPPHRYLEALAADYPLSFHGVAASLGGTTRLDAAHLARWRALVDRYAPVLVSEHLAWGAHGGTVLHDLLPLPYTQESLDVFCEHVDEMQTALGRTVLVENPARYVDFRHSTIPETEFLCEAAARTGCGLLLDVNNVYVSARNLGEHAADYLRRIPAGLVGEIHLAGHSVDPVGDDTLLVDDHGSPVTDEVWRLYADAIEISGRRATLIEWDSNVPELEALLAEAGKADRAATAAMRRAEGERRAAPG